MTEQHLWIYLAYVHSTCGSFGQDFQSFQSVDHNHPLGHVKEAEENWLGSKLFCLLLSPQMIKKGVIEENFQNSLYLSLLKGESWSCLTQTEKEGFKETMGEPEVWEHGLFTFHLEWLVMLITWPSL